MKTYILKENQVQQYYECAVKDISSVYEAKIKIGLMGLEEIELKEAKKKAEIGDCLLLQYGDKILPYQVVHRRENGNVVLVSYFITDNHIFDEKTNVWKDSEIRRYLNHDIAKKFDPELLNIVKPSEVHTDDYTTQDKFWLLSHEEIGYEDTNGMFKKNVGAETFDYFKMNAEDTAKSDVA